MPFGSMAVCAIGPDVLSNNDSEAAVGVYAVDTAHFEGMYDGILGLLSNACGRQLLGDFAVMTSYSLPRGRLFDQPVLAGAGAIAGARRILLSAREHRPQE